MPKDNLLLTDDLYVQIFLDNFVFVIQSSGYLGIVFHSRVVTGLCDVTFSEILATLFICLLLTKIQIKMAASLADLVDSVLKTFQNATNKPESFLRYIFRTIRVYYLFILKYWSLSCPRSFVLS